jgi:2-polyprenyl-6-methoxyphenol hydroxylase-like FAD-dependent oxidoreductase
VRSQDNVAIKSKKILVVGGGIAGVTLARFLRDSDYTITIIERASEWRTIGFAIGIWLNGLEILKKLDLPESFWKRVQPISSGTVVNSSGDVLYKINKDCIDRDQIAIEIAREELHTTLVQNISKDVLVRFNTTCKTIEQISDKVIVTFSDDTQESFDLVVGADGIRSSVREKVFGSQFLHSYGWHAVVGWVPSGFELSSDYHIMNAPSTALLAIPYGDKFTIGFSVPKSHGSSIESILKIFEAINPRIKKLVSVLDHDHLFYDEMMYVKMNQWHKGNVVLIGDARHGMSPISGFGTSLALGDAYELSECLKEFSSLDQVLIHFSKRRTRDTKNIFRFAWLMERGFTMKCKWLVLIRDFIQNNTSPLAVGSVTTYTT